ncbi:uncharacterized protein LOC131958032 [Physella acuta]|uniref:uncharacterized protein LOC131958032 n=1 Tax=Physella acuta TaxID=109671 RepID=UPI0027DBF6A3|nr:uncharacterized protein LOC131958032 [Physella acuta]
MSRLQAAVLMTSLFVSVQASLVLDFNCFDWQYWEKGSSCLIQAYGYCTCHLVNSTGTVTWYTSKGKLANQEMATNQTTSKLIVQFPASKSVRNETFVCKAISTGQPEQLVFKTQYSDGPGSISLRLANATSNNVDLCPGKPREATVYCEVPASSIYPEPWFHMSSNGSRLFNYDLFLGNLSDGTYRVTHQARLTTPGELSLSCMAFNSCHKINVIQSYLKLNVREPPTSAPELYVNDQKFNSSGTAHVTAVSMVTVTCSVTGVLPAVSSVTVRCGTVTVTSQGSVVYLQKIRARLGSSCTCTARHVTNCYVNNTTTVTLVDI